MDELGNQRLLPAVTGVLSRLAALFPLSFHASCLTDKLHSLFGLSRSAHPLALHTFVLILIIVHNVYITITGRAPRDRQPTSCANDQRELLQADHRKRKRSRHH